MPGTQPGIKWTCSPMQLIDECFRQALETAMAIEEPFEQAFRRCRQPTERA